MPLAEQMASIYINLYNDVVFLYFLEKEKKIDH